MNRLKELRKEKKLTQKELAQNIGAGLRTIQTWENGESQIKPDKAQQLADFFGVSVGYLLGYDEFNFVKQIKVEALDNVIKSLETAHVSLLCKRREAKSFVAGFEVALMIVKTSKELLEEEEN